MEIKSGRGAAESQGETSPRDKDGVDTERLRHLEAEKQSDSDKSLRFKDREM